MTHKINYKPQLWVVAWLETALKKEWEKYAACPVKPDMVPGYELAQAWGFVIAGYFLIEQGLKAVLHVRGREPAKTHTLSILFAKLDERDRRVLEAFYDDFLHTFNGMASFPLRTLDEFLVNLDGATNDNGQYIGSFDWRYFLTQEESSVAMPLVSVNAMHEIVFGCVQLISSITRENERAERTTYSWRLRWLRSRDYQDWLMVRMNLAGWDGQGDRLEKLWGPDYRDRYDYLVFEGKKARSFFAQLPELQDLKLPMVDKRGEIASFNKEEGFKQIGITVMGPVDREQSKSKHLMF